MSQLQRLPMRWSNRQTACLGLGSVSRKKSILQSTRRMALSMAKRCVISKRLRFVFLVMWYRRHLFLFVTVYFSHNMCIPPNVVFRIRNSQYHQSCISPFLWAENNREFPTSGVYPAVFGLATVGGVEWGVWSDPKQVHLRGGGGRWAGRRWHYHNVCPHLPPFWWSYSCQ